MLHVSTLILVVSPRDGNTYRHGRLLQGARGCIDGFQMSIKRPTSGGQTRDQEAAVQQSFHLERNSFFYLSVLMVRT